MDDAEAARVGHAFAARWLELFAAGRHRELFESCFADHVRFYSPAVHAPYTERGAVLMILSSIVHLLRDFTYHRYYVSGADADGTAGVVLLFSGRLEGGGGKWLHVEGVDLLRVQRDGRACELKVMLRPLKATVAVAKAMGALIQQGGPPSFADAAAAAASPSASL